MHLILVILQDLICYQYLLRVLSYIYCVERKPGEPSLQRQVDTFTGWDLIEDEGEFPPARRPQSSRVTPWCCCFGCRPPAEESDEEYSELPAEPEQSKKLSCC